MKKTPVFIIMVFLQLGVFIAMVASKEMIIKKGNTHKFQIVSRDPYDFMRGNYLSINLEQTELTVNYGTAKKQKGYLLVEKDGTWSRISEFTKEKPETGDYVKGKLSYSYNNKTYFQNPFQRFYMEKEDAKKIENKIIKGKKSYIIVKIYRGKYVIESIEIEE